ncbi:MAG TPA: hypothetical protein VIL24_05765, partial [Clostridia bacterium]
WVFLIFLAEVITYLIIMSPKINLRLSVFLGVSAAFLIMFILILTLWVLTTWAVLGIFVSALYCAGTTAHLIKGKRTIKDILEA